MIRFDLVTVYKRIGLVSLRKIVQTTLRQHIRRH